MSHELFDLRSGTAIEMAIMSRPQRAGCPLSVALPDGILPKPSWVKISQVRTISVERLGKRLAALNAGQLNDLVDGLLELIA